MNDFQWLSMLALYCEYWWMKKIQKDDCVTNCNSYMRSVGLVQVSLMFCAYIDHNIPWHQRVMPIVHCMAPCFLNIACEFLHMQFPSGCSCILHILQGIAQLLFQKFFSSTGFISIFVFQIFCTWHHVLCSNSFSTLALFISLEWFTFYLSSRVSLS